ncbi:MAG: hypothetical protein WC511_04685 [Candidatus Pacearchaeota archaeon]
MAEVISFNKELEDRVKKEFGDEATPEFINLLKLGQAAYEHGYFGFVKKEKVIEWVGRMYDAGEEQKKVRDGEKEGHIIINSADVINSASYLSFFGEREGYLSK